MQRLRCQVDGDGCRVRKVELVGEAQDVLLYRERKAYLRAVGVAIAGLEEARVILAK